MAKWLKISYKGEMRYVDLPDSRSDGLFLDAVLREIGCDWIEFVHVRFLGKELCFMIDELGKLKDGWEDRVNHCGSLMYAPGVDCIVGDLLLGRYQRLDDGEIYVVPCEEDYYKDFVCMMTRNFSDLSFVEDLANARD